MFKNEILLQHLKLHVFVSGLIAVSHKKCFILSTVSQTMCLLLFTDGHCRNCQKIIPIKDFSAPVIFCTDLYEDIKIFLVAQIVNLLILSNFVWFPQWHDTQMDCTFHPVCFIWSLGLATECHITLHDVTWADAQRRATAALNVVHSISSEQAYAALTSV